MPGATGPAVHYQDAWGGGPRGASPRCPWRAANRVARSGEPETAEAGPLQHVADGIADTLNEGRETDGTKADETETDGTVTDGARN